MRIANINVVITFFFYNAKLFLNVKSLVQNFVANEQTLKDVIISVATMKWWEMHWLTREYTGNKKGFIWGDW